MRPYLDPALREHLGAFVPLASRNFFAIAMHYDPSPSTPIPRTGGIPPACAKSPTRARSGAARCGTTSGTRAPRGWRPRWRRSCCTPVSSTTRPRVARDRLDHARAARRARPGLAAICRTNEMGHRAGQGVPGRVDAARLDAPRPRPPRLRAAALPAPTRLRHELRHRQVPHRGPDPRRARTSSATPSRSRPSLPR
jgi:hypothetical protein